jgi:hypothetical protein
VNISVYKKKYFDVEFHPLSIKRDWMDSTFDKHAYKCFPVSIANGLGWTFSYPEDISFIWDGDPGSSDGHVEVLSGKDFVFTSRANATISFYSGLTFTSDNNVSLLLMPTPNQFIDGVQGFTNIISTSVLKSPLPYAWKITKANEVITIPAGTPIVSIIPIGLSEIQKTEMNLYDENFSESVYSDMRDYGNASAEITKTGEWSNFYRDAVNHRGEKVGEHEIKSFKLKVNDKREIE